MSEDPTSARDEETGGDLHIQAEGDIRDNLIAGRDVIQNIVIVGRFLDFAKVEGLIPKSEKLPDLKNIGEAFETAFKERLGYEFAEAAAAAGAILKEFLEKWGQGPSFAALPFRKILEELPQALYTKLSELGYWDNYILQNVEYRPSQVESLFRGGFADVLELSSLSTLWAKHFDEEIDFSLARDITDLDRLRGLAETNINQVLSSKIMLIHTDQGLRSPASGSESGPDTFLLQKKPRSKPIRLDTSGWNNLQFRIFMVGLVLDLIRIGSLASTDKALWGEIIGLVTPGKSS